MSNLPGAPGFAPADPTDGRPLLDWESKYVPKAKKEIRVEAFYLGLLLAFLPVAMLLVWLEVPRNLLRIPPEKYPVFSRFAVSWLSGTLGGTLFALKWFYHTVARHLWNLDRRLWRIFTPHISGGLSFSVFALVTSGIVRIFDSSALNSMPSIIGMGFLVGYFSDSAIAKLTEVATTLFGVNQTKKEPEKQLVDEEGNS